MVWSHYELMDLNKCGVFQSISVFIFIDAQMVPSVVKGKKDYLMTIIKE